MAAVVGGSVAVVEADGFHIDELAGNVATKEDTLSIAFVSAKAGASEPWLTLHYDEWIAVRTGSIAIEQEGLANVTVRAGQTVKISKGTRFRPSFPEDTTYIPVCIPAFSPSRCIREDVTEEGKDVALNLKKLHASGAVDDLEYCLKDSPEVLYHMTSAAEWEQAIAEKVYYPKTYEQDGHYTHATGVPSRLVGTANHFYQDSPGDWVCLQFRRAALKACGIHVRDEEAMPVGDKDVDPAWVSKKWICPHVVGGLPTSVVEKVFKMTRDEKLFTGIEGLV